MRDEFKRSVVNELARRAGHCCSNPNCQKPTVGPDGGSGSANIGVAAHISAAANGGPRYDPSLSSVERSSIENGIWLCQTCSRLIDVDELSHPPELLSEWKRLAEMRAYLALRGMEVVAKRGFDDLERKMPDLFMEMRQDLVSEPFIREFIVFSKKWCYGGQDRPHFFYFLEDHEHLLGKVKICENYGAVVDVAFNDVARYEFTEEFVEYLGTKQI